MHRLLLAVVGALTTAAASANDPFPPVFGGSVLGESGRVEGNVFSVFPLNDLIGWGPSHVDSVLFAEPMIGWQEGGATSASFGLGFRQLFGDPTRGHSKLARDIDLFGEGIYVGGNVFADWLQSERGLDHWQLSSGIEIGSRYVSLHANYYWPLSQEKRYAQARMTSVRRVDHREHLHELSIGPEINLGPGSGSIRDMRVNSTGLETHTISETRLDIGFFEEALRGWDTGVALLVPGIDRQVDLRLIASLYSFGGGDVARDFSGWRAGIEFRPVPSVVLMASHFCDDRYSDGQWMAGVRFEIHLGAGYKSLTMPRRRALSERLTEPVRRQDHPTVASGATVKKTATTTVTQTIRYTDTEQLNLTFVPMPGDILQLSDGTVLKVEADGRTLSLSSEAEAHKNGSILVVVPEPSRAMLLLLGVAWGLFRRRRLRG